MWCYNRTMIRHTLRVLVLPATVIGFSVPNLACTDVDCFIWPIKCKSGEPGEAPAAQYVFPGAPGIV